MRTTSVPRRCIWHGSRSYFGSPEAAEVTSFVHRTTSTIFPLRASHLNNIPYCMLKNPSRSSSIIARVSVYSAVSSDTLPCRFFMPSSAIGSLGCTMDAESRYPQSSTSRRLLSIPPLAAINRSARSVACGGTYNKASMSLSFMGFREESKTVVWSAVIEEAEEISEQ
jgi:hypothetical protein